MFLTIKLFIHLFVIKFIYKGEYAIRSNKPTNRVEVAKNIILNLVICKAPIGWSKTPGLLLI